MVLIIMKALGLEYAKNVMSILRNVTHLFCREEGRLVPSAGLAFAEGFSPIARHIHTFMEGGSVRALRTAARGSVPGSQSVPATVAGSRATTIRSHPYRGRGGRKAHRHRDGSRGRGRRGRRGAKKKHPVVDSQAEYEYSSSGTVSPFFPPVRPTCPPPQSWTGGATTSSSSSVEASASSVESVEASASSTWSAQWQG